MMSKILSGSVSECKWVDNNPQFYDNRNHQEIVKRNIKLRYKRQLIERNKTQMTKEKP